MLLYYLRQVSISVLGVAIALKKFKSILDATSFRKNVKAMIPKIVQKLLEDFLIR